MADKKLSVLAPPPSRSHHRTGPKRSPVPHQNGSLDPGPGLGQHGPRNTRTSVSPSPLRTLRTLAGLGTGPALESGPEGSSSPTRPRGASVGSGLSSRTRTNAAHKRRSSQQAEPEALLDLILESQGQRLDDQRASLSLLPDPGPAALCGACNPDQPSLDFYYMLIQYQSDRMEDQRSPLPVPDHEAGSGPEGQEDFFSLIQRIQSRRMDEQRALMTTEDQEDQEDSPCASSSLHHH